MQGVIDKQVGFRQEQDNHVIPQVKPKPSGPQQDEYRRRKVPLGDVVEASWY